MDTTERTEWIDDRERLAELRRQHRRWQRAGYDGHNRHGGITTMHRLRERRRRRLVRRSMSVWAWVYTREELAA